MTLLLMPISGSTPTHFAGTGAVVPFEAPVGGALGAAAEAVGVVGAGAPPEQAVGAGPVRRDADVVDGQRGRLFIAHMGASELIDVDVHAQAVVRTLPDLSDVHGVIVVPDTHR